jgi:hypothetical protein
LDWTPTKVPREEEVAIETDGPFANRAWRVMDRELSETGYVAKGTGRCDRIADLYIFRCAIENLEEQVKAVWIYAERQADQRFSTYFLF